MGDKDNEILELEDTLKQKVSTINRSTLSLKDIIKHTVPFDGSNFAFNEWSEALKRNIDLANIGDEYGEILFNKVLTNKAKIVWDMSEVASRTSIQKSLELLKKAFDNSSTRLEAEEKIHSTKQTDYASVMEYVKEQVKNCRAVNSKMDEESVIAHIRRNLHPEFKKQIYLMDFKTIDHLILTLDKVEKNTESKQRTESKRHTEYQILRKSKYPMLQLWKLWPHPIPMQTQETSKFSGRFYIG